MTTDFVLVRHAVHDRLGRVLVGRMAGVRLSAAGRIQAQQVAERLAGEKLSRVLSSPQPRAQETAAPIAAATGLGVEISADLDEVDIGAWQGRTFADLDRDPAWRLWNEAREAARPPGGESIAAVQARMVGRMEALARVHPGETIALVSHAEPIRVALLYWLGLPLSAWMRLDISPASIARLEIAPWGARLLSLNERAQP